MIVERFINHTRQHNVPVSVTMEITLACNQSCHHCYNFDRSGPMPEDKKRNQLTPNEIKRVIGEIAEAGALMIAFSGGEALLHPHLLEFVREARRHHLAVRVKTNGTLVTIDRARALFEAGVTDLDVSLYGATARTHDEFTKTDGSFVKTIEGVRNGVAVGMSVQVNYIINKLNFREIGDARKAVGLLGARFDSSTELTERYDGSKDSVDWRMTEADLRELFWGPERSYFMGSFNDSDSVQCSCAKTNAGISSTGEVYPCIGAPIRSGHVREQSFNDIWKSSEVFRNIRELKLKDFKKCSECPTRRTCQRSSGSVFVNTGDYTGAEDWVCREAELLRDLNSEISSS